MKTKADDDEVMSAFAAAQDAELQGDLPMAVELAQRGVELAIRLADGAHAAAHGLLMLGKLQCDRGNYEEATSLYEQCKQVLDAAPADSSLAEHTPYQYSCAVRGVALVHQRTGRYEEARVVLLEALRTAEARSAVDSLELGNCLNDLGAIYKFLGHFDKAQTSYRRSLEACDLEYGEQPSELGATLCHNLGGLAHARGDFANGEPFARRGVGIREQLVGEHHPDVASDLVAWASILDGLGRHAESEPLYQRARDIIAKHAGETSYEMAVCLNNEAAALHSSGECSRAESAYLRALEIHTSLGIDHPDIGTIYSNLAELSRSQGRHEQATMHYQHAMELLETLLGLEHPKTIACREALAEYRKSRLS